MTAIAVSCHVEVPLWDPAWRHLMRLQRSRPGGLAITALMRPPDHGTEPEDVWLQRAREAAGQGPFGHHTHWGGLSTARPLPVEAGGPERPEERVRTEAVWLREHGLEPRFYCAGGWFMSEPLAGVLADEGYVDCSAPAFEPGFLDGQPRISVAQPTWLSIEENGRRLLELPSTHTLGMAVRLAMSGLRDAPPVVHVCFHDWELAHRRRRVALRWALSVLGRRCRQLDLSELAREASEDAGEVPFQSVFRSG